jgi:pimeloyl-ACP methyl ester carboxylesterase
MTARTLVLFLISCIVLSGSSVQSQDAIKLHPLARSVGSTGAIVFVHGITGHWHETWGSWADVISKDKEIKAFDLWSLEYPTPAFDPQGKAPSIGAIATKLGDELEAQFARYNELVFVAHSMGGNIVRRLLLDRLNIAAKTRFALFAAVPALGSPFGDVFKPLNKQHAGDLRWLKGQEGPLNDIWMSWQARSPITASYCVYETKGYELPTFELVKAFRITTIFRIVPYSSASALCNRPARPIDADHDDIVKNVSGTLTWDIHAQLLTSLAENRGCQAQYRTHSRTFVGGWFVYRRQSG